MTYIDNQLQPKIQTSNALSIINPTKEASPSSDKVHSNELFLQQNDLYKELTIVGSDRANAESSHGEYQDLLNQENKLRADYHAVIKERAAVDTEFKKLLNDPDWNKVGTALYQFNLLQKAVIDEGMPSVSVNGDGRYEGTILQLDTAQLSSDGKLTSGKLGEFAHQVNRPISFSGDTEVAKKWLEENKLTEKFKMEQTINEKTRLIPVYNKNIKGAYNPNTIKNQPFQPFDPKNIKVVDPSMIDVPKSRAQQVSELPTQSTTSVAPPRETRTTPTQSTTTVAPPRETQSTTTQSTTHVPPEKILQQATREAPPQETRTTPTQQVPAQAPTSGSGNTKSNPPVISFQDLGGGRFKINIDGVPSQNIAKLICKTDKEYEQDSKEEFVARGKTDLKIQLNDGREITGNFDPTTQSLSNQQIGQISSSADSRIEKDGIIYRDERSKETDGGFQTAYVSAEAVMMHVNAAMEAYNRGDMETAKSLSAKAKKQLEAGVEAALVNDGRVPRLYYADGKSVDGNATNGDVSAMTIAFNKYLNMNSQFPEDMKDKSVIVKKHKDDPDEETFIQRVTRAQNKAKTWLTTELPSVGNTVYKNMGDKNTSYESESGSKLETLWTESISGENEIRRAMALGDKKLLASLTRDLFNKETGRFASGLIYDKNTGTVKASNEYASDALSLLILANDKMGTMTPALANQFKEAYLGKRDFSSPDGKYFGYQVDFSDSPAKGANYIPEFMYMDALAGQVLAGHLNSDKKLTEKAQVIRQNADNLATSLGGGYSNEYALVGAGPSGMTLVMSQQKGNYYADN